MDQDTAQAITVIEKQMAEMNQKITQLQAVWKSISTSVTMDDVRLEKLERAAKAFSEGLGK